ncbi:MAG: TetR/AcrR family transcriptional regulator [Candidatus Accumulibacter sp.]|jgi:AcrR family transcriptional regulator|nr:TetR/AcrR family transcriptional regulator [Accumulibacter sp.]
MKPPELLHPRRMPRQARSRALVEAILESAARVLVERGYAGMNTNLVAERAGVSIGSLYQYFPNKDSLIAALHERHGTQMRAIIETVLTTASPRDMRGRLAMLVHAGLAAHRMEPELHRVLEREFPILDAPGSQNPADQSVFRHVRRLLEDHRDEVAPRDLDLAVWMVLQTMATLVHIAVITPPPGHAVHAVEEAIVDMLAGYVCKGGNP